MKEKVLLLSNIFPCKNFSGGLLSKQLVAFLLEEKHEVFCCKITDKDTYEVIDDEMQQKIKTIEFGCNKINNYSINKIVNSVLKYIKKNKITKIWIPLQGELIIKVLYKLSFKTTIPFYVQIWDPIEWVLKEENYSEEKQKEIIDMYEYIIKKANFCFTASIPMKKIYLEKYGVKSNEIFTSITVPKFDFVNNYNKEFTIIFSGQTYAENEIKKFIEALDELNWKYKNRKIVFKYFGNNNFSFVKKSIRKNIHFMGYTSQDNLMRECNKANLLYCPYFFSEDKVYKKIAIESFPSKVTTYIPTKTPILVHAPEYTSIYTFFEGENAAYLLSSKNKEYIKNYIKELIEDLSDEDKVEKKVNNSLKLFNKHFLPCKVKEKFFDGLGISYDKKDKVKILEVNNVDLSGKRFNGYDIMEYINSNTDYNANQIVTYKTSNNKNVYKFYNNYELEMEYKLMDFEYNKLSVHSNLSLTSPALLNSDLYKNSDIIHFHLFHNTKLSLYSLLEFCQNKKVIMSIHDPWNFTGRCVHYESCNKWKTGCKGCPNLKSLFPLKKDNCDILWNLKKNIYQSINPHIIVSSQYMYDLLKTSPLTKHFTNTHLIPFGVNLKKFNENISVEEARKKLKISKDDIVLFFRSQDDFKGTNYIIEALNKLETNKKITILTCSQKGNLKNLYDIYKVIELGNIDFDILINAYRACDIFLMPSIGESFGMMAIEAMACGKPVIVFNNTALPSVTYAPECGILVKNKDSQDLMEKIKWLIEDDEERLKRSKLFKEYAIKYYNEDRYNENIVKLYEEVYRDDFINEINITKSKKDLNQENLIKYELNKFTKTLSINKTLKDSLIYKNLIKPSNDIRIDYSNLNVQKNIDDYNKKLFLAVKENQKYLFPLNYNENKKIKFYKIKIRRIRPIRWTKRFIYLYKNDQNRLKEIFKYEFRNHPTIFKYMIRIYKKFKRKV